LAKKKNIVNVPREMTHRQLSRHKKQQRRQRFIFFGGLGVILAVILIIVGGWYFSEYAPFHQTVLQVYDTKFDAEFFIDALALYGKSQGAQYISQLVASVANQIQQNEILRVEAAKLGISVSDEEGTQYLADANIPFNQAALELVRGYLLSNKVKTAHFTPMVSENSSQLWVRAMMVESESVAKDVRGKIINGENFTELVKLYAVDSASASNNGDYGWHPLSLFNKNLYSTVALDYVSEEDVKAGDVSQPLTDNTSYKKVGYWLIRVNERPDEESANVSAIFLGSEEEALDIRAKLLAGDPLGPIADNSSQYEVSKTNHGEMGVKNVSENVSPVYNAYVTGNSTKLGVWSDPLKDDTMYTKGGYWVVQIAGKADNKALTANDRDQLINDLFINWMKENTDVATPTIVNNLNDELVGWMVVEATDKVSSSG
jgi:parvulin-like peptidyl-prolyl isomerase